MTRTSIVPRWLILAAFCGLAGCAAPRVVPLDAFTTSALTYDQAWDGVVEYLTVRNWRIRTIDKASGLIFAEAPFSDPFPYADCGRDLIYRDQPGLSTVNVLLRPAGEGVKVTVTARFQVTLQNAWTRERTPMTCPSQNLLEPRILRAARGEAHPDRL